MTTLHDKLKQLDHRYLWHPFTQMQAWMAEDPVIISGGDGHYLIDDQGRKYLDGVSSLWVTFMAPQKELDDAIKDHSTASRILLFGPNHLPGIHWRKS